MYQVSNFKFPSFFSLAPGTGASQNEILTYIYTHQEVSVGSSQFAIHSPPDVTAVLGVLGWRVHYVDDCPI